MKKKALFAAGTLIGLLCHYRHAPETHEVMKLFRMAQAQDYYGFLDEDSESEECD